MPRRALKPCPHRNCPALTDGGYCPTHQREAYQRDQQRRGTAAQRGYDSKWARYSRRYRREHPVCVMCPSPTEHTDHIIPVTGPRDPLFWKASNHQPLCQSCHSRKTVTTDRRGLNHPPPTVFATQVNGTTGLPTPWFV